MNREKGIRVGQQHTAVGYKHKRNASMLRRRDSAEEKQPKLTDPFDRSLQMLAQDQGGESQFVCESLDVVDACRGTSVSYRFRGSFVPYDGPCDLGNKIIDGYPIYKTVPTGAPNEVPKYMYAIDVYSQNWAKEELRGLVRWRIVDFEDFRDQTSCRTESANVNQLDFAADGQPYNYWPTIFCFDENGREMDGYKSSTINIRCNDRLPSRGNNGDSSSNNNNNGGGGNRGSTPGDSAGWTPGETPPTVSGGPGGENSQTTLILGILLILAAVFFAFYFFWNRFFRKLQTEGKTAFPNDSDSDYQDSPEKRPKLPKRPSGNQQHQRERTKRPISINSTNSIMADSSQSGSGGGEEIRPSSMHTVSKPYELVERRMVKKAPEPPKIPSPSSSSSGVGSKKFIPNSINDAKNKQMNNGISSNLKQQSQEQTKESPKERGRDPPEKKYNPDGESSTFMSESLSKAFKNFDKSLDEAIASTDEEFHQKTGQNTNQSERTHPTEEKPSTRRSPPSFIGKHDEMDLSARSRFMQARGKWSARGRGSDKLVTDKGGPRSRSFDSSQATKYAAAAKNTEKPPSQGRWGGFVDKVPTASPRRSRSKERSVAGEWAQQQRAGQTNPPRSRSKERSASGNYAETNQRKTSNNGAPQPGRSRSKERSGADAFAARKARRSRSRERSASNAYAAQKDTKRGRSKERSGANDYAAGNLRPKSLERSGADGYAKKRDGGRPSRSMERTPAGEHHNSKQPRTIPKSRSRSFDASMADKHASERGKGTGRSETPKARSRSFDSSKANNHAARKGALVPPKPTTIITKNRDGTIVVARKRRRDDGATVVTKTKYANISLARKHGIDV